MRLFFIRRFFIFVTFIFFTFFANIVLKSLLTNLCLIMCGVNVLTGTNCESLHSQIYVLFKFRKRKLSKYVIWFLFLLFVVNMLHITIPCGNQSCYPPAFPLVSHRKSCYIT